MEQNYFTICWNIHTKEKKNSLFERCQRMCLQWHPHNGSNAQRLTCNRNTCHPQSWNEFSEQVLLDYNSLVIVLHPTHKLKYSKKQAWDVEWI